MDSLRCQLSVFYIDEMNDRFGGIGSGNVQQNKWLLLVLVVFILCRIISMVANHSITSFQIQTIMGHMVTFWQIWFSTHISIKHQEWRASNDICITTMHLIIQKEKISNWSWYNWRYDKSLWIIFLGIPKNYRTMKFY